MGMNAAQDLCESIGPFVDYMKFRHLYTMLAPLDHNDLLMRKVRLFEANDIRTFPGGIVFETAYLRGKVEETFAVLCRMGFTAVELSDNMIELTQEEKEKYTRMAVRHGLRVLSEFGKKYATSSFSVEETVDQCRGVLEAGATTVIVERSELDLILGPKGEGGPEEHKLIELAEALTLDKVVFEAETPAQQTWLFNNLGPDVSIGPNLAPERIAYLEAQRRGLGRESGYTFITKILNK
jgi:phosphosulfolactate synthase